MKTQLVALAVAVLVLPARAADAPSEKAADAAAAKASAVPELGTGVVAVVGGHSVPYEWFVYEYRNTAARRPGERDLRQKVIDDLVARMVLYDAACASGITNDPAVRDRIDEELRRTQEYMNYQLAMGRIAMTIEAYLKKEDLVHALGPASEEVARAFFDREIAGKHGAPASYDDVPPQMKAQIRAKAGQGAVEQELRELVDRIKTNVLIEVNQPLVDHTPEPEAGREGPAEIAPTAP